MKLFLKAAVYALLFLAGILLMRWLRGAGDPLSWFDLIAAIVAGSAFASFSHIRSRRRESAGPASD